ncbi:MAG TPA: hypothetical protein VGR38_04715, partial [Candidatus Polarisedimenticolia bacterium]|nr:hypothetical protein [Candidatus Polarisedimenticolia bacterium]
VEDLSLRPALMIALAVMVGACLSREVPGAAAIGRRGQGRPLSILFALAAVQLWWVAVLNPYRAHLSDAAMRTAKSYATMETNFQAAQRRNPFQAQTYRFPATAFLATRPEPRLTLDLYARFRRDLERGMRYDRTSADSLLVLASLETRALRSLFHDSATRDRALKAYRSSLLLAPRDPRIRVELAGFLRELGRTQQALSELTEAVREEPAYLTAHLLRTRILLDRGEKEAAIQSWSQANSVRDALATYRADSSYAFDLTRDPTALREEIEHELGPS